MPDFNDPTEPNKEFIHFISRNPPNIAFVSGMGIVAFKPIYHNEQLVTWSDKGISANDFYEHFLKFASAKEQECNEEFKKLEPVAPPDEPPLKRVKLYKTNNTLHSLVKEFTE